MQQKRNLGIEKSHGDYLYFIDSDDWIDKRAEWLSNKTDKWSECFMF